MESKAYYIKSILKTLGICVIGLLLSKFVFTGMELFQGSEFLTAAVFAGLPFGWMAIRHIFGGILVWGFWGILIYGIVMLALSFTIGWMIMCYRFIKDIVQLIIVCCAEKKAATV